MQAMERLMALIVFFALTATAALFGAEFLPGDWYRALAKPVWTPPNAVFGPVWTVLYIMIAIAGWLIWQTGDRARVLPVWGIGLLLNALWSWLFFGRHLIGLALMDIVLIWTFIVAFIVLAWPRSRVASFLFMPYLAWVSLATALNFSIWRLNG